MMPTLYRSPVVEIVNDRQFQLVQPFVFEWQEIPGIPYTAQDWQIVIPAGFIFDGASIPRIFWTLTGILPSGVHLGATAVHDYGYQRMGRMIRDEVQVKSEGVWTPKAVVWDRKRFDDLFLQGMTLADVNSWKEALMFQAVRGFGRAAWYR